MLHDSPPTLHPGRWTLNRAGIVNVWHYFDVEFQASGGRLILRGTNGAGKSRAMEMLVPFLLDADKRRMDATGSGKVSIEDLMKVGIVGATGQVGGVSGEVDWFLIWTNAMRMLLRASSMVG